MKLKKFKFTKETALALIEAGIYLIIGLFFIFDSSMQKAIILYIFSIGIILAGLVHLISFICWHSLSFNLLRCAVELIVGIITLFLAPKLRDIHFLGILFGVYFLILAVLLLEHSVDSKKLGAKYWWIGLIVAIVLLVFGFLLIFIKSVESILTTIIGIALIIDCIFTIVNAFTTSKDSQKYSDTLKDVIDDDKQ